ncbi:MAG: hypothetical protein N2376_09150 [Clostridia bacterium]|nr:hypothetical protein [Clostridia bacterium]
MADQKHRYNEKRIHAQEPPKDNRGMPVPGTGHDTKKIQQKGP